MATYKDLNRVSNQSCVIAYDIYGKLWDGSYAKPPETYEFERYANFQIGGHFGCNATITTQLFTTGCTINNPFFLSIGVMTVKMCGKLA
jgi:hypothetical protein